MLASSTPSPLSVVAGRMVVEFWRGYHPFEGNTMLVSEKGSSSTGVPIPANAEPFAKRIWLQRHVPQCPMYGAARKMDYATLGVAYEGIDPTHPALGWCAVSAHLLKVGPTPVWASQRLLRCSCKKFLASAEFANSASGLLRWRLLIAVGMQHHCHWQPVVTKVWVRGQGLEPIG